MQDIALIVAYLIVPLLMIRVPVFGICALISLVVTNYV